jgi:hypothetical protein
MARRLTAEQVRKMLVTEATAAGGKAALAVRFDCSPAYLGDVINGKREPGAKVLGPLGLEREVRYVQGTEE